MVQDMLYVEIWRGKDTGRFEMYRVPHNESQTILDVVTWVQRNAEPALAYRFACRVGMCGSCAMTVNGRPRWTCRSHISKVVRSGHVRIEPLRNLPRIKDLVVDMAPFFEKWRAARGQFKPSAKRSDPLPRISPESSQRRAANAGIECINCGVCHAACDVVAWNADYLGPAALNRSWTLANDERDADRHGLLSSISKAGGCHSCHTHGNCVEHCPVGLNPAAGIAGLKRMTLTSLLGGDLG